MAHFLNVKLENRVAENRGKTLLQRIQQVSFRQILLFQNEWTKGFRANILFYIRYYLYIILYSIIYIKCLAQRRHCLVVIILFSVIVVKITDFDVRSTRVNSSVTLTPCGIGPSHSASLIFHSLV